MFGVSPRTWAHWIQEGRIACGQRHRRPGDGHTCVLYPESELRRLRDEFERLAGKPYPDPHRPGVWRVPLKGFGVEREALIDELDLPIVDGVSRFWADRSDGSGGFVILAVAGRQRPLHRLILGLRPGDPASRAARVSFANGDPLDCRRQNLVVRTSAQVTHAAGPVAARRGNACVSGFKGVSFSKKRGKWVAKIRRGELNPSIGEFDDERAAAEAYDDCARVWFGEHAWLNFPHRPPSEEQRARAQGLLDGAEQRHRRRQRRVRRLARRLKREARVGAPDAKPAPTADEGPTIGSDEARRLLGVPRATWRRWEKRRRIPGRLRVSGRTVYPFSRIKRLLEACGRLRAPYPDPGPENLWRVPLVGRGIGGRREVLIDASSVPLIEGGWCMTCGMRAENGKDAYVILWSPVTKQRLPLRRLIANVTDDDLQVGHRNDDALDCRRANLVVITPAERCYRNRKITSINGRPTTSRFKGVSRHKGKWTAMIHGGGKARYLGRYAREEDAARAYDDAARELYGQHARLNFPDDSHATLPDQTPPNVAPQRNAA